ncbi:MAG: tripeptide aminopeptidase PepT, partial [Oscillospiraceae bacterium]
ADYAYTIDGGTEGEIEYENFNAASLTVTVNGVNIHPGSAKNQMINSQLIAIEFNSLLPAHQVPECTEGYEGFYLFDTITGNVEKTVIEYIIRDHDRAKFEYKKDFAKEIAEFLNKKYGENTVIAEITDSYYNMKEKILPNMFIIDNLIKAMEKANVTPDIVPIRGGTDGARLSFRGLPCPNMGTGGQNFHGRYEYISVQAMERVVEIIKALVSM